MSWKSNDDPEAETSIDKNASVFRGNIAISHMKRFRIESSTITQNRFFINGCFQK